MNIVHIAPCSPYNDDWGYQENLLPKYQAKLGHNVSLIITNREHQNNQIVEVPCSEYYTSDKVRVIRMERIIYPSKIITKLLSKISVFDILCKLKPDFIFFHGLVSATIFDVVKYRKRINNNCIIVQDNHLDYNIGMNKSDKRYYFFRMYYRLIHKLSSKYITKVYGVTPWRKQYAEEFYKVSNSITDILIMGADDDKINFKNKINIRSSIRKKYGINEEDFLIITGGKIDKNKNIDLLIKAVKSYKNIKLLIFGSVAEDMELFFEKNIGKDLNIIFVGWIDSKDVYDYFFAADLAFFPGQHSVLWEQACASKIPCVFKRWEGMEHVNNGGNSDFLNYVSIESIKNKIDELHFTSKYYKMLSIAQSSNTDVYLYSSIAEKSIEAYYINQ